MDGECCALEATTLPKQHQGARPREHSLATRRTAPVSDIGMGDSLDHRGPRRSPSRPRCEGPNPQSPMSRAARTALESRRIRVGMRTTRPSEQDIAAAALRDLASAAGSIGIRGRRRTTSAARTPRFHGGQGVVVNIMGAMARWYPRMAKERDGHHLSLQAGHQVH